MESSRVPCFWHSEARCYNGPLQVQVPRGIGRLTHSLWLGLGTKSTYHSSGRCPSQSSFHLHHQISGAACEFVPRCQQT